MPVSTKKRVMTEAGEKLKQRRLLLNMTQEELAERSRERWPDEPLTKQLISRIELGGGVRVPAADVLARIGVLLGMTAKEIFDMFGLADSSGYTTPPDDELVVVLRQRLATLPPEKAKRLRGWIEFSLLRADAED